MLSVLFKNVFLLKAESSISQEKLLISNGKQHPTAPNNIDGLVKSLKTPSLITALPPEKLKEVRRAIDFALDL